MRANLVASDDTWMGGGSPMVNIGFEHPIQYAPKRVVRPETRRGRELPT
jgi:hypothetical protein